MLDANARLTHSRKKNTFGMGNQKKRQMTIADAQLAIYGRPGRALSNKIRRAAESPKESVIKAWEAFGIEPQTVQFGQADPYTLEIATVLGTPKPNEINVPKSVHNGHSVRKTEPQKEVKLQTKTVKTEPARKSYMAILGSDILALWVICSMLIADMIAFYVIAESQYQGKTQYPGILFAYIGLACGIGAAITYYRIPDHKKIFNTEMKLSESWKWLFGLLQFICFEVAMGMKITEWETVMPLTLVLVFMGVLKSVKA